MSDLDQTRRRLRKELGREPEIQEIARELYPSPQSDFPINESESTRFLREKLESALEPLTPIEKAILIFRFGLIDDGQPWLLREIAREFGLEYDWVRNLEGKALKLRRPDSGAPA
jgi:DNA-directed RNA polymerase sigma subunit (sigma70/sigma32)